MASESSFDVVSRVDQQELDNALNQTRKEIENRFDFKHSKTEIEYDGKEDHADLRRRAQDAQRRRHVFRAKAVRRGIDVKAFEFGAVEPAAGSTVRQVAHAAQRHSQGPEQDADGADQSRSSSRSTRSIRTSKFAFPEKTRTICKRSSPRCKAMEFELPLQFVNYR